METGCYMKKILLYDDYNRLIHRDGVIGTIVQQFSRKAWKNGWKIIETETITKMAKIYRIRKLTPRECFRLMGVSDEDIDKIQNYPGGDSGLDEKTARQLKISESQQYKMFGNSIVVQVLEGIFTQMFRADSDSLF